MSPPPTTTPAKPNKHRLFIGILLGIVALGGVASFVMSDSKPHRKAAPKEQTVTILLPPPPVVTPPPPPPKVEPPPQEEKEMVEQEPVPDNEPPPEAAPEAPPAPRSVQRPSRIAARKQKPSDVAAGGFCGLTRGERFRLSTGRAGR